MNILIPHTWLLEHLETAASPQEIQKHLSLCGPSIERIYDQNGESVYDIEVTTNRVDMMSVRGIAREAAVILPQFGIPAQLKSINYPEITVSTDTKQLPQIENNPELCQRISCVVLDVTHTPTPDWMASRLTQIGQTVHDSVIDITNYVTHELGHPCHAFDYDKIMQLGGLIRVIEAAAGQAFQTLDGANYTTQGGEVVFVNQAGTIIDLPAIKGTANTAVDSNTKTVLLWIESIPAKKIRTTSMGHAIRTVAAQLNEKQVDPNLAPLVLARAVELYQQLSEAQVASAAFDTFPGQKRTVSVRLPLSEVVRYLGIELDPSTVTTILSDLGCQVSISDAEVVVTPPTFRPDISIVADVVEEIARIYGYHRLPSKLMEGAIPTQKPENSTFRLETRSRHFLANLGWQELYTYSMVSEELATQSGLAVAEHVALSNPLTDDRVYLRRTLIPSLYESLLQNSQTRPLSVFEIASIYEPQSSTLPQQQTHLTLVTTADYRSLRGVVEAWAKQFFINGLEVVPSSDSPLGIFAQSAELKAQNHQGHTTTIGQLFLLTNGFAAATIPLNTELLSVIRMHPLYQPLAKTAPMYEDLTFMVPKEITIGQVMTKLHHTHELVKAVELSDVYQRNFSFRITYSDPVKNLSAQEIEPVRRAIVSAATELPGVALIGTLAT